MSASICWRPSSKQDKTIGVFAPSSFLEMMASAGMKFPCTVTTADLPVLRGMAAVFGRNKETPNPFNEMVDLIEKHDSIDLWAVY
jgi:hypothetical protein